MIRRYAFYSQSLLVGLFVAGLLLLGVSTAHAQEFTVEGTVLDAETGTTLPGVNVVQVGTQRGTSTGPDGTFELDVLSEDATLRFSFVGYQTQTVDLNGRSELTVELQTQAQELDGVVVTALGIERQQRSVGYATSQIEAQDIVDAAESNPANLLQGNVPGLVVSPNAGGPNSSTNIKIRGTSAIGADNDPLFIVDGVPIDNSVFGSAGRFGGRDGGSALSVINPDNIQNISVLKGAGAAALYGSRARDGVVLVETKSGRTASPSGYNVSYTSTLTARNVIGGFTDYQQQYGQGQRGNAPTTEAEAEEAGLSSWGARYSQVDQAIQFDGETRPYTNTLDRTGFYETGLSQKHSLALSSGFDNASFRLSGSYLNDQSVVPNTGYQQGNISFSGQASFGNLEADAKATYVSELYENRVYLNDAPRNPNYLTFLLPSNIPLSALKPGYVTNSAGNTVEKQVTSSVFQTNPYWAANRMSADDDKDRLLSTVQLNYEFSDWISLQAQTGLDFYTLQRETVDAYGTAFAPGGNLTISEQQVWESNTKVLLSGTPQLTDDVSLRLDLGGNLRHRVSEGITVNGGGMITPYFRHISNLSSRTSSNDISKQQIRSFFGSAAFDYNEFAFLTVTGRSDWSSTLPTENIPFFYPSVSGSFVFTEPFELPEWFNYGKLRAAWGQIGGDTSPYQLNPTYSFLESHQGQPLGLISQNSVPNSDLKPTTTTETEVGLETQFFDDRFGIDLTFYRRNTVDQILTATVSGTSGYRSRVINSGEIQNSGVELLLSGYPIVGDNFSWEAGLNFGANRNEVKSLSEGLDIRLDAANRVGTANIAQIVGEAANVMYGHTYVRDDQGRIVHDENGVPLQGPTEVLGSGAPDWTAGFSNTVSYEDFTLNFLVDAKWGGQIFSGTNANAFANGLHKETLEGRAACEEAAGSGQYPDDCFNGGGVIGSVNADGEVVVDRENDVGARPSEYYGAIAGNIAEEFVYDANFVKLRQVRLSYGLPSSLIDQTPLSGAQLSLVGRNLFYIYDSVPNVSPESSYNSSSAPGFEQAGVPETRSIGFTVNVQF
ncbi:SusC/RagA family TonB-linked outer membrane protein [Salinibacter sp. 10B]|uniref:SusC/RagA family TonB-linked outer membrane protein n=1 Tax=Salinibacter sp. 10B TaxID=1923971 RepID=UPI000CF575D4|nr:SusC/RagA family TonB-linked outer membrane protein [Salinibacter sp. 10B]PQJ34229.1 SusC/RagA family TonB-linked outer membrane protein [Salinibacter sp. 10B]